MQISNNLLLFNPMKAIMEKEGATLWQEAENATTLVPWVRDRACTLFNLVTVIRCNCMHNQAEHACFLPPSAKWWWIQRQRHSLSLFGPSWISLQFIWELMAKWTTMIFQAFLESVPQLTMYPLTRNDSIFACCQSRCTGRFGNHSIFALFLLPIHASDKQISPHRRRFIDLGYTRFYAKTGNLFYSSIWQIERV